MKMGQHTGKVIFRDLDGNLVMDRKSDPYWWDEAFVVLMLEQNSREKGVKIVKTTHMKAAFVIECVVDYLSRKVKR